jgi:hypothetical protein
MEAARVSRTGNFGHRAWLLAGRVLFSVGVGGCGWVTALTQPPWPSADALAHFDFGPIEQDPAIRRFDRAAFVLGADQVCHFRSMESSDFPNVGGAELQTLGEHVRMADRDRIRAEVERLHPGDPRNEWATKELFIARESAAQQLGDDAARSRGCEAVAPEARRLICDVLQCER